MWLEVNHFKFLGYGLHFDGLLAIWKPAPREIAGR